MLASVACVALQELHVLGRERAAFVIDQDAIHRLGVALRKPQLLRFVEVLIPRNADDQRVAARHAFAHRDGLVASARAPGRAALAPGLAGWSCAVPRASCLVVPRDSIKDSRTNATHGSWLVVQREAGGDGLAEFGLVHHVGRLRSPCLRDARSFSSTRSRGWMLCESVATTAGEPLSKAFTGRSKPGSVLIGSRLRNTKICSCPGFPSSRKYAIVRHFVLVESLDLVEAAVDVGMREQHRPVARRALLRHIEVTVDVGFECEFDPLARVKVTGRVDIHRLAVGRPRGSCGNAGRVRRWSTGDANIAFAPALPPERSLLIRRTWW